MLEPLKFGLTVVLGYLISFGFNQVQTSAYQSNLESQNKSIKVKYLNCETQVKQIKGVVEKW
jgi:hypothetical protein